MLVPTSRIPHSFHLGLLYFPSAHAAEIPASHLDLPRLFTLNNIRIAASFQMVLLPWNSVKAQTMQEFSVLV